jgi:acetoacetyl-CoA synthetase
MTTPLWTPSKSQSEATQMARFQTVVEQKYDLSFCDYQQFQQWSIDKQDEFWGTAWDFLNIRYSRGYDQVLRQADHFSTAQWFIGSRLNFAENLLQPKNVQNDSIAIISLLENGDRTEISYAQLYKKVEALASALRMQGLSKGDRVAGYLPNIAETVVAMLATTSIGAIWSSCSPDFGINGVVDRFGQIEPKILFAADGYYYNGKTIDCLSQIHEVGAKISSLEKIIVIPVINAVPALERINTDSDSRMITLDDFTKTTEVLPLEFEQLPFDHPLYIMYSSGTTGVPKCIVHSAGGTLIQQLKELRLHTNIDQNDVLFYFTTCGWMMWNWLVAGLGCGSTIVLYDGSPFATDSSNGEKTARENLLLLSAIDNEKISVFGTSAKFISTLEKQGYKPRESHQLESLKTILSTGSPLSHESFDFVYRDIKADICLSSICGGTDIVSCFLLGNPTLPVFKGELQCRGLGMAVEIWNEKGRSVFEEKGELVCTKPMPCCPIGFWNDADNVKFHKAYFSSHENVWSQGDYGEVTGNKGFIIHGRSDAVLNPGGVRIGTAEIYRQVEKVSDVLDCIVVGQEWENDVRVILFVVLRDKTEGAEFESIKTTLKTTIRNNTTPRHVPAKIIQVPEIPRTISGKIVELAVRNIIHHMPVNNTDALANPGALQHFHNLKELQD